MIELTLYQQQAWFELACYFVVGVYFCVTMRVKSNSLQHTKEQLNFKDGACECIHLTILNHKRMCENFDNEAIKLLVDIIGFKWRNK